MTYRITKTYGHDLGLSACFRQPRATSHCRFLHGYALSFKFTFEAERLDPNNWVLDFGSLKPLKEWLCDTFDHKLLAAEDDPALQYIRMLAADMDGTVGALAQVEVLPAVGCEAFAKLAWEQANELLYNLGDRAGKPIARGVRCTEVEVREHGANSAIYVGEV